MQLRAPDLVVYVPSRTAMEIVGATTIARTMNVYLYVTFDEKREALEKLGNLFEEGEK